jgi:hypothetical protein
VPPEVTDGRVVVVVGGEVVVVVVVGTVFTPPVDGSVVVGVVVDCGTDVDVEGSEVDVDPCEVDVLFAALAPGCSLAATIPITAVAPAAARNDARVSRRSRTVACRLVSGELWSSGSLISGLGSHSSARVHQSGVGSRSPQGLLWAVCERRGRAGTRCSAAWT